MERDIKRCQIHNRFNYIHAILEYMTCIVVDLWQMANEKYRNQQFQLSVEYIFLQQIFDLHRYRCIVQKINTWNFYSKYFLFYKTSKI